MTDEPAGRQPGTWRLITWFADNPVAANLLMFCLLLGGALGLRETPQQVLPPFDLEGIRISMGYPGAGPGEVERGLVLPIEHAVADIPAIAHVRASAGEGQASLTLELRRGADPAQTLQEVRSALSRITTFPAEAGPPHASLRRHGFYVISLGVAAEGLPRSALFTLGERLRRALLAIPGVSDVQVRGGLHPEIAIEIPSRTLRQYDLDLEALATRLRDSAREVAGGRLSGADGEILLRSGGQLTRAAQFAALPVIQAPPEPPLPLERLARVREGFEDAGQVFEFNGRPGLRLDVYKTGRQDPVEIAAAVRALNRRLARTLPEGVRISVQNDRSQRFAERRALLLRNGALGLLLVILTLGLFLNPRLAFWVAASLPVVFTGAFALLPQLDVSINMISMFAFILTLGIVVDDAIIVGENIHARRQQGLPMREAIRIGAGEMTVPVLYAVGTNIIAFIPLLMVPGAIGRFMHDLPVVVSVVFAVSLIEALLILPAHLRPREHPRLRGLARRLLPARRFHQAIVGSLDRLRDHHFQRLLRAAIRQRWLTLALFLGAAALVAAWYLAGRIDLTWRPEIPGNRVDAELDMPVDAPQARTLAAAHRIEAAGLAALERLGGRRYLQSRFIRVGSRRPTFAEISFILVPDAQRPFTQETFTREWRRQLGDMPEARSVFFEYLVGPGGNRALQLNLSHPDTGIAQAAARALAEAIRALPGVVDVDDGIARGKRQIVLTLSPEGRAAGLDAQRLGRQLRDAFYGAEVQRVLRNGHEVKVMLRLPPEERRSLEDLYRLPVRTPDGGGIRLARAARIRLGRAAGTITREDGRRIVRVSASIDKAHASTRRIRRQIETRILPALQARYPGLQAAFAGGRRDRQSTFRAIFDGLLWSVLAIYVLFAALFRSHLQALIVMLTIPFAIAGAVAGHVLMGHDLSSVSVYGMIALGGLVVNGALVLTVRLNECRRDAPLEQALLTAALGRFRPILLTAMTTTAGLLPMLFETAPQALFLVPMAIALTFGTLAALLVVLLLIPALYRILQDLRLIS